MRTDHETARRKRKGRRGAQSTPRLARTQVAGSHAERSRVLPWFAARSGSLTPRRSRKSRRNVRQFLRPPTRDFRWAGSVTFPMGATAVRDAWITLRPLLSVDEGTGAFGAGPAAHLSAPTAAAPGRATQEAEPFKSGLDGLDSNQQLERLIVEHGEAVYRVALSVVRDHLAAEDIAQEALLKAWQALPSYRGEAPLRGWLLRIAHNTAVSAVRRRRDEPIDPSLLPESAPTDSTEHTVERRAAMAAFETALAGLDDLSRSITVLREIEGMSYEDIAEMLKVPLPTVKTRLLRARRVLAVSLEGWRP